MCWGHRRKFSIEVAIRLHTDGIGRSKCIKGLATHLDISGRAARRWVKQLEDEGLLVGHGSPVALYRTEKTASVEGWRKGRDAIAGAVSAMPTNSSFHQRHKSPAP